MPGKRKQRRGGPVIIDQVAMLENMEYDSPIKFYHSPVDIQKNSLANYMDQFQGQKDLKHQTSNTEDLQAELEQKKAEIEAHKDQLQFEKQQQQAVEKNNSELRLENNPWKKRAQLQAEKDKNSHLMASHEEAKQHVAQLEMQAKKHAKKGEEVKALKLELQSAKQQQQAMQKNYLELRMKSNPWKERAQLQAEKDKNSHLMASLEDAEKDKSSLVAQLEKSKATHLAQAEEHEKMREEMKALKLKLRSAKQQQQAVEKNNSELRLENNPRKKRAQLQAKKDKNSHLMASHEEAKQHGLEMQAEEDAKTAEEVKALKLELQSAKQQQQAMEKNYLELRMKSNPWKERAQLQAEKDKNSHLMASLEEAKQHLTRLEMEAEEHAKKALKLELQSAKQLQALPNVNFELKRHFEIEKAETQKLHHECRQMVETLQKHKEIQDFHQAKLEEQRAETNRFAAALKQTQDLLGTECNRYEMEKHTILQNTQIYVNSCVAQLNGKEDENRMLKAEVETLKLELQSAKQLQAAAKNNVELDSYLEKEKAQTLQKQKEMQDFHQAQLEEQKAETTRFAADLKKTQHLLETERHRFEQEKESIWKETQNPSTSCLAQLNGEVDENRKLEAEVETLKLELRSAKQLQNRLESDLLNKMAQLQAEKDQNSHLMASLKEAEQDKSSLMAQLELSQANHLAQIEMQTKENKNTMTEMKKKLEEWLRSAKQLKAEKEALQNELEAKNDELRAEKRLIAVEKTKMEMELENTLLYERAQQQAEKDKYSHLMASLKEAEQDKSSLVAQLDEGKRDNTTIEDVLKQVGKQLEIGHLQWKEERTSLLAQLEKSQATHHAQLKMQAEKHINTVAALKKKLEDQLEESEKTRASYVSQLDEKKQDNNTVVAALKEVEKQLKIGQLQWQEDKTSLTAQLAITEATQLAQLEVKQEENKNLMAALKRAEQQLDNHQIQWKDEKSSFLQKLQDKEQEWQQNESSMRTQLEDLESQIGKKKKKWYRKFF
ncbi:early endosome antigen 1-like [Centropristis striata]|uniref:early endosome antigen 1-like n=1 Tax=Centropristis striata TaxID=184440 RepID=UPI0027E1F228|nr:early endosome antigen 1-like [Centropristis striata]